METELERLVIRLVGDAEDAIKMYDEAVAKSRSASDDIEKENARMEQRAEQIARSVQTPLEALTKEVDDLNEVWASGKLDAESYERKCDELNQRYAELTEGTEELEDKTTDLQKVMNGLAGTLATLGAKSWLQQALGEWQEAETTAIKLNAAITANGRNVDQLSARYSAFASEMQRLTVVGDDQVLSMIQQAENFGLTGMQAERAVKNTLGAQAAGMQVSIRTMAMLEQGNTQMLGRVLPGLRGIKDESERAAKAQELLGKMFGVAEAEAKSSAGSIQQLKNNYGDLMEQIGKVVAEGIAPLVRLLSDLAVWLQSTPEGFKQVAVAVAALTVGFIALATTLPLITAGVASVSTAVAGLTVALATNPLTLLVVAAGLVVIGLGVLAIKVRENSTAFQEAQPIIAKNTELVEKYRKETEALIKAATGKDMGQEQSELSLKKSLEDANAELVKMEENLKKAREAAGLESPGSDQLTELLRLWMQPDLAAALEGYANRMSAVKDRAKQLESQLETLANRDKVRAEKATQSTLELTDAMELQIRTWGMSADRAAIYRMALEGASEESIRLAEQLVTVKERMEESDRESERARQATERWMDEMHRSAAEGVKAWERIDAAVAQATIRLEEHLEDAAKAASDFESNADHSFETFRRNTARSIEASVQTPLEKFNKELEKINMVKDLLGPELTKRAIDKITEAYEKTDKQVKKVRDSVKDLDATLYGSASAVRLIERTKELGRGSGESGMFTAADKSAKTNDLLSTISKTLGRIEKKKGGAFAPAGL